MNINIASVQLTSLGPKLSPFDVHRIELEMRAQLPDDYREFLLAGNGGTPEPPVGFAWGDGIREVGAFWKLLPTQDHGLRRSLRNMHDAGIYGYLPIAGVSANDVCLTYHDNSGVVTITEYIYRDDFVVGAHMHRLAESFTAFMSSLVQIPVPHCCIENLGKRGTLEDLTRYLAEGNSINAVSHNDLTILCEAIAFKNLPLIEACIRLEANLSQAIVAALRSRSTDLIRMLANAGADVNEPDKDGNTPLWYLPGTQLPGAEGAQNRRLHDVLIELGAHE